MWYFMGGGLGFKPYFVDNGIQDAYILETFFEIRKDPDRKLKIMEEYSSKIIIDSGAFTFMNSGTNMTEFDMDEYFKEYKSFIERNKDNPKIVGFFELDVDRIFGVEKALYYLNQLKEITDKVIPVWHNTRSIQFYYEMCKNFKRVAISQAFYMDVLPEQLNLFINTAHYFGAKIHLLGFARFEQLEYLNLGLEDSFDAVSYCLNGAFCHIKILNKNLDKSYDINLFGLKNMITTKLHFINTPYHYCIQQSIINIDNSVEINTNL